MSGKRSRARRDDDEPGMILETGKEADGRYKIVLSRGDKHYEIPPERVYDYVAGVMTVASWADHDSAVMRQLLHIGLDMHTAGQAMLMLRDRRTQGPPTEPLTLQAGVAVSDYKAFITVRLGEEPVGQWSPRDAQDHCAAVLGLLATTEMDDAYHDYLVQQVGIEEGRANNVVNDLQNFRTL